MTFISSDLVGFMKKLKYRAGKHIWLVGGGEIENLATAHKLADELMIFTMPVIFGEGLPLFKIAAHDRKLQLLESKSYESGVVATHYQFL